MNDNDLRDLFPQHIVHGALLRPDGCAVGLVGGGAPAWDLRSSASRAHVAEAYHRLLLAQDAPLDIYSFDGAPDLANEITDLYQRSKRAVNPAASMILDELADYLDDRATATISRSRLTIWAVTVDPSPASLVVAKTANLSALFQRAATRPAGPRVAQATAVIAEAVARARRLADALASLGGVPLPRLLEAEEIARLLFRLTDPLRAARYPLAGTLLERIRHMIIAEA